MNRKKRYRRVHIVSGLGLLLLLSLALTVAFSAAAQTEFSYAFSADFEEYTVGDTVRGKEGNGVFVKINQAAPSLAFFDRAPDDPENTVIRLDMAPGEGKDAEVGYDYICFSSGNVKTITWQDDTKEYGTCDSKEIRSLDGGKTCFFGKDTTRMYQVFHKKGSYEMQMGGVNIDRNLSIANPEQTGGTVVLEVSVYIPKGASGHVQAQTVGVKGLKADGSFGSLGFRSLYAISLDTGVFYNSLVTQDPNYKSYSLQKETWNTISVAFDLDTGVLRYYVNNIFVFEERSFYSSFVSQGQPLTLTKNCWVIGKIPRDSSGDMNKLRGCCYFDRVRMHSLAEGEIVVPAEEYGTSSWAYPTKRPWASGSLPLPMTRSWQCPERFIWNCAN